MKIISPTAAQIERFRESLIPFQTFNEDEWTKFSALLSFRLLKKKEFLVQIGEICQDMVFLDHGTVRYFFQGKGEYITNYFSFDGELIAAYGSFISGKPSLIGLEALENSSLLVLNRKNLDILSSDHLLSFKLEQMRRKIAEYLILCYEDRVLSFLTKSPEERYLELLNYNIEVFQKIPQHYIAHYLGITPVSLSRIRNRSRRITA